MQGNLKLQHFSGFSFMLCINSLCSDNGSLPRHLGSSINAQLQIFMILLWLFEWVHVIIAGSLSIMSNFIGYIDWQYVHNPCSVKGRTATQGGKITGDPANQFQGSRHNLIPVNSLSNSLLAHLTSLKLMSSATWNKKPSPRMLCDRKFSLYNLNLCYRNCQYKVKLENWCGDWIKTITNSRMN